MAAHHVVVPCEYQSICSLWSRQRADERVIADLFVVFEANQCRQCDCRGPPITQQQIVTITDRKVLGSGFLLEPCNIVGWKPNRAEERVRNGVMDLYGVLGNGFSELHCVKINNNLVAVIASSEPEALRRRLPKKWKVRRYDQPQHQRASNH